MSRSGHALHFFLQLVPSVNDSKCTPLALHTTYNFRKHMTNHCVMSDDYSVETIVISNLSSRGNLLRRWAPPLIMFVVGSILISRESNHNSINKSAILRSFNERRELYTPYDKTTDMKLPAWTNSISDIWEPLQKQETPFFWDIPNAGGSTLSKVFSHCLGFILATNQGAESDNTVSTSMNSR